MLLSAAGSSQVLSPKLVLTGESPSTPDRSIGLIIDARWAGPHLYALVQEKFITDPPAKLFVRYNFLLGYWEAVGCAGTVWNFDNSVWDMYYQNGVVEIAIKTPGSTLTTDTIGAYVRIWKSTDSSSCWSTAVLPYSWSQIGSIRYLKTVLFVAGIRGLDVFPFTTSNYLLERLSSTVWYDHAKRVDLDTLGPMSRGFWGPSLCLNGLYGDDCSCAVDRITAGQVCSQGSYSVNVGPNPILIYPNSIPVILTNFTSIGGTLVYVIGGGAPPQIDAEGCVNISGSIVLELEANGTSPVLWTLFRSLSECLNIDPNLNVTVDLGDSCYTATAARFQSKDRLSVAVLFDDSGCSDGLTPLYIGLACAAAAIVVIIITAAVLRKRWVAKRPKREQKAAARSLDFYDLEEAEEGKSKKRRNKLRDSEGSTVALSSIQTNSYSGQTSSNRSSVPETSPASESSPVSSVRSSVS